MFEQELELEKRSSWGPLLLVVALVSLIVGVIGYYVFSMKKGLPVADATSIIETQLRSKSAILHFHSGKIVGGYDEDPKGPHYKVLEKAGFVKVKSLSWNSTEVTVTDVGEQAFTGIPGYKKWKNADDSWSWDVPLATRKLEKIDSITLNNLESARVEYEWKWVTNSLGEIFDLEGGSLKNYTAWDRQKLIDKYGANFYHSAAKKEVLNFKKGDKGWEINTNY
jgi:hypothetical protein